MNKLPSKGNTPSYLNSATVNVKKTELSTKVGNGERLTNKDIPDYWKRVKNILRELQNGKCCFCERVRDERRESDVEHFRPKLGITEEPTHLGYWWLVYDWGNLLFSCQPCNQDHKKNQFPLLNNGIRAWVEGDPLDTENPVLINPFIEDPDDYFEYEWTSSNGVFVKICGLDNEGRGEKTKDILDLNRVDLMEGRAKLIKTLKGAAVALLYLQQHGDHRQFESAKNVFDELVSSDKSYLGFRKYYFRTWGLEDYL